MSTFGGSGSEGLVFDLPGSGRALFTTRAHSNLSSVGGLAHEHGLQARENLRTQLGLHRLARGYQVHGTTVLRVRVETDIPLPEPAAVQPLVQADGHATSAAGIGVMALAADCLPVALGNDGAVAMIHAGWRGLAAGVLEEGARTLRELDGEGEIVAVIGPGAGVCCYEVGHEVHAALEGGAAGRRPASRAPLLQSGGAHRDGRGHIDLKAIARDRLLAVGVSEVLDTHVCTICDERFFSHRREGANAGRNAGVAWLSQSR